MCDEGACHLVDADGGAPVRADQRRRRGSSPDRGEGIGRGAIALAVDVREQAQVDVAHAGRLDVWVNNAGVLVIGPVWDQDEQTRRLMLEINDLGGTRGQHRLPRRS